MGGLTERIIADVAIDRATAEKAGGSMGNGQSLTQQFITYACEKVGGDEGGEFVAAIPAQFV